MKVIHSIGKSWTQDEITIMKEYGIEIPQEGFLYLTINEIQYDKIKHVVSSWNLIQGSVAVFTKKERDFANLITLDGLRTNGYPQPSDDFGYLNLTFDTTKHCPKCGIGKVQNAPFQIKKEPKWNKNKLFTLEWVFDEVFVEKEFYHEHVQPLGIDYWPVLLHKSNQNCKSVVQLKLPTVHEAWDMGYYTRFEICPNCGEKKYDPMPLDFFPSYTKTPSAPIFKSQESFGSMGRAFKQVIINQDLRQILPGMKQLGPNTGTPLKQ